MCARIAISAKNPQSDGHHVRQIKKWPELAFRPHLYGGVEPGKQPGTNET
jgi:hypothetical protein